MARTYAQTLADKVHQTFGGQNDTRANRDIVASVMASVVATTEKNGELWLKTAINGAIGEAESSLEGDIYRTIYLTTDGFSPNGDGQFGDTILENLGVFKSLKETYLSNKAISGLEGEKSTQANENKIEKSVLGTGREGGDSGNEADGESKK